MTTAAVPTANAEARRPARIVGAVTLLFVLGVALPLAVASHYGALGIPRSDDWSYLVTLFRWIDDGRLAFNDWVSMTLVGQLVLAAPLVAVVGRSVWAVQVFSAFVGFAGLLALTWLGRQLLPRGGGALLLAATIAIGPLWAPLDATFMTDVPAFTMQMISLALAVSAFRRSPLSLPRFGAALAVGFFGISIRQYGAIPVLAIVIAAVWFLASTGDRRRLRAVLVMSAVTAVATAALLAWWANLPDSLSLAPEPPGSGVVAVLAIRGAGFLRLTGLLLVPVVVWAGPVRIVRVAWAASRALTVLVGAGTTAWLGVSYLRVTDVPFVGNYVDRLGVLANDALIGDRVPNGGRVPVMPTTLFDTLVLFGSIGGVLLALATVPWLLRCAARVRDRDLTCHDPAAVALGASLCGFAIAYALATVTDLPVFDRYALPAIPLAGLLLLRASTVDAVAGVPERDVDIPRWTWIGTGVAAGLLAVVGLTFATDSASFDATRWRVATRVTEQGFRPLQVYGGFEWVAYHRERGPRLADTAEERQRLRKIDFAGLCVDLVVEPTPRDEARAIAHGEVHGLLHGPETIVAVRNDRPCAP